MPTAIVNRDSGRKPYLEVSKGIDGGYVNEMSRPTQQMDRIVALRQATETKQKRRGEVLADRAVTETLTKVNAWTMPTVSWGICFDASGGMYVTQNNGDIWYKPSGGSFEALGQTSRAWEEISCAANGDIYAVVFATGIYIRAGGAGDFTIFEAGSFTCVEADPNGDVYAMKSTQLYVRHPGGVSFELVTGITQRGYSGLSCAPNGDLYGAFYGSGGTTEGVYVRTGRTGDFVQLNDINDLIAICDAPNGDVFTVPYGSSSSIYRRQAGAGDFLPYLTVTEAIQSMAVSPTTGYLYVVTGYYSVYILYLINAQTVTQQPANTIVQNKVTAEKHTETQFKNLKPYENQTYGAMTQYSVPVKYTGKNKEPESAGRLPVLVGHIEEISRFVRSGNPVVVSVPTTFEDPVAVVTVEGGGDGTATIAPSGTSVVYKPGLTSTALLVIKTKSGQQCTATLMAK